MTENYTVASLEIFGSRDENDHIEITGFAIKTDPTLKIVSSLAHFLGSAASGASGIASMLPVALQVVMPELLKIVEGLRSGELAEDDDDDDDDEMSPIDMSFIIGLLNDFGLKVAKPDGSELTKEEIDEYNSVMTFDEDAEDEDEPTGDEPQAASTEPAFGKGDPLAEFFTRTPTADADPTELTLIFIVNGQDVPLKVSSCDSMKDARNRALAKSGNTGRPMDEWEVRTEQGVLLDADLLIAAYNFTDLTRLFLSLRVGVDG